MTLNGARKHVDISIVTAAGLEANPTFRSDVAMKILHQVEEDPLSFQVKEGIGKPVSGTDTIQLSQGEWQVYVAKMNSILPAYDDMVPLPVVKNSYHYAKIQALADSNRLTLYRKKMRDTLTSMKSSRVLLLSKGEFNSGSFVHKLPLNGAAVFVIDDPFNSSDTVTTVASSLLDDPRILAAGVEDWRGPEHAKLTVLPIGLASKLMLGQQGAEPLSIIENLSSNMVPAHSRKYKVTSDAQLHLWHMPTSGYRDDRENMAQHVEISAIDDWYTKHIDLASHLQHHVAQAKLALCPEGNGLDTHRFYHAYALGTRCIVREDGGVSGMHSEFPGTIVVKEWSEVNADNIAKWLKLENLPMNQTLLTADYWIKRVLAKAGLD
jgi:hypothetical protein